ncbi:hypothetical protein [Streptomyces spectabilis]|uniref:Lipoprotein n=1 Tax=Streptomyces spectabilis TaxID=68270 RepID=A0A5P2WYT7_STRST|nr:hypothetical protein [Streptomyces spectabilis]MBB5108021.1 hypothetical protein [Streptomyces spectabilis]MCI3907834.1 hypothetical protein [Streptomyces spectabilis]MCI3907881.1 hypothetical protein [Streptomyces spectabilis]QEV57341.1 hypothetical protein CP982_00115 [Streptomyces spectabilis]GGV53186.1 hypothetical protein GCM10010245_83820 [Streptomyces spectabilis]
MSPREGKRRRRQYAAATAVVAAGVLVVSACGTDGAPQSAERRASNPPGQHGDKIPGYKRAYAAGYEEGRKVYDDGGKGAAVREVVHGGCARRALDAGARADGDRGSWVKGCQDAVQGGPKEPPARPMSKKESHPALLKDFRAWARTEGDGPLGRHADQVFTVKLTGPDYDVEVRTDYTSRGQAKDFAGVFAEWWDGDDGPGVARSVLILDGRDRRIAVRSL